MKFKKIKELEAEGYDNSFTFGYETCKEDVLRKIDERIKGLEKELHILGATEEIAEVYCLGKEIELLKELESRIKG